MYSQNSFENIATTISPVYALAGFVYHELGELQNDFQVGAMKEVWICRKHWPKCQGNAGMCVNMQGELLPQALACS